MSWLRPGALRLLLFCALLLNAASLSAVRIAESNANLSCVGEFTRWRGHCYHYPGPSVRRTFHHAERHCGRFRAYIASLLSLEEESFAVQLVQNKTAFWIGLTDQSAEPRQFRWTDGSVLSPHSRWREGEPSNTSHLHCAQADHTGWALASGGCSSTRLPFICKKQACPQGLEWGGTECDIITDPTPSELPSILPLSSLSHPALYPLFFFLCMWLVATLAVGHHYRTKHTQTNTHSKSPPHIQDLYPT